MGTGWKKYCPWTGQRAPMKIKATTGRARMQMLPLLDVIFLVTVFLAYAMLDMSKLDSLDVILPQASNAERAMPSELVIGILENGNISFASKIVDMPDLGAMLGNRIAEGVIDSGLPVQIYADRNATVQKVIAVLEILNGAGFHNIAFQVRNGDAS